MEGCPQQQKYFYNRICITYRIGNNNIKYVNGLLPKCCISPQTCKYLVIGEFSYNSFLPQLEIQCCGFSSSDLQEVRFKVLYGQFTMFLQMCVSLFKICISLM